MRPYEGELRPALIKMTKTFEYLDEIDLSSYVIDNTDMSLQGVAYDDKDDALWFTDSKDIFEVDKNGKMIRRVELPNMYRHPNGIAYDADSDSIWILGFKNYLINIAKDGKVKKRFRCNYRDQDQIMLIDNKIFFTVGADYNGSDNYLGEVDLTSGAVDVYCKLLDSYAVEGCCVIEDKLYIFNDGYYHSAAINENVVQVYEWAKQD
ncbi:MAG: hypothetical protein J1F63_01100 [Oscillospiraceae bacterium]|nr:hypothetical protein [Oscillospiraceae bacterium]